VKKSRILDAAFLCSKAFSKAHTITYFFKKLGNTLSYIPFQLFQNPIPGTPRSVIQNVLSGRKQYQP
jgi:hypothetical protein